MVKNLPALQESLAGDMGSISGSGSSLEKEIATHCNIIARNIPWTEETGGLQFMGRKESCISETNK